MASAPAAQGIPDEDHGVDLPMTMTASVILTQLPMDKRKALEGVEEIDGGKGTYSCFTYLGDVWFRSIFGLVEL
jgi:hypothetical protein